MSLVGDLSHAHAHTTWTRVTLLEARVPTTKHAKLRAVHELISSELCRACQDGYTLDVSASGHAINDKHHALVIGRRQLLGPVPLIPSITTTAYLSIPATA